MCIFSLTGTTERVCLIKGTTESVMSMLTFICEKIRDKPDPNAKTAMDFNSKTQAERNKQQSRFLYVIVQQVRSP